MIVVPDVHVPDDALGHPVDPLHHPLPGQPRRRKNHHLSKKIDINM